MIKSSILFAALIFTGTSAYAVEPGVYQQLQEPTCFHAVQLMNSNSSGNLALVQFAGSCVGSAILFCESNWCTGEGSDQKVHILNSLNSSSYIYMIEGETTVFRKLQP